MYIGKSDIVLCCVSKQILIHELSPVLILHIKRFSIESLAYRVTKDNRPLPFPFVLDMAPFCTTECIEVCIRTYAAIHCHSYVNSLSSICDNICENRPCSHLVVIRETLV